MERRELPGSTTPQPQEEMMFYDVSALKNVLYVPPDAEELLFRTPKEEVRRTVKSICVIGNTGVGKSATCKTLVGSKGDA